MIRISSVRMRGGDIEAKPMWVMMSRVIESGEERFAFFRLAEDRRTWVRYSPSQSDAQLA